MNLPYDSHRTEKDIKSKKEQPDGLFGKYHIERTDGTPIEPGNQYFVLKLEGEGNPKHIEACRKAIVVYANEIYRELPELANDLLRRYDF